MFFHLACEYWIYWRWMRKQSPGFSNQLQKHVTLLVSSVGLRLPPSTCTEKQLGKNQCHFFGVEIWGISNKAWLVRQWVSSSHPGRIPQAMEVVPTCQRTSANATLHNCTLCYFFHPVWSLRLLCMNRTFAAKYKKMVISSQSSRFFQKLHLGNTLYLGA